MFKRLKFHNFQAHRDSVLELVPGINTIVGVSDSGKSSIIRGISSVLYRTEFYLTKGEQSGHVGIEFDDYDIRREYTATKTRKCPACKAAVSGDICSCGEVISDKTAEDIYYTQCRPEGVSKFGTTLPDFLLHRTRIFTVNFVDVEVDLNLSKQHDDMFFIGTTYRGGARNKILSSMVPDSDKVDHLIKELTSKHLKMSSEKEYLESIVEDQKKRVEMGEPIVSEIEKSEAELTSVTKRKEDTTKSLETIKQVGAKLKQIGVVLSQKTNLEVATKYTNNISAKLLKIEAVRGEVETLTKIKENIGNTTKVAKLPINNTILEEINKVIARWEVVAKELAALFKLNIAYLNAGKDITLLEIDIGRANEEIAELEEEIAAEEKTVTCPISGKVCPVLSK